MRRHLAALALAFGLALTAGSAAAVALKFPIDRDARFDWQSYHAFAARHDLAGQPLTIVGPWRGEAETQFEAVLDYFRAATGARVGYAPVDFYDDKAVAAAADGANITVFTGVGPVAAFAAKGDLTPLGADVGDWLADNYAAGRSWAHLATYRGPDGTDAVYTFPYNASLKSLVWYVPSNFRMAGYRVPRTMEELKALTRQIVRDGGMPWCIGLASGAATGWPATDWVEDMMLRTQPPEVYDGWVDNSVPFDDPRVVAAIDEFGWFAKDDRFVEGGAAGVASMDFRDAANGLFSNPPRCYLHRQASFMPAFFPEGTKAGVDADFFYLPAYESAGLGRPMLGASDLVGITRDSPTARAFIEWLQTPIAHELWMAQTGFLTPYKAADLAAYANDVQRHEGQLLLSATTFRFDASDMMPAKVGVGAFWTGMIDYVKGKSAATVAAEIQKVWNPAVTAANAPPPKQPAKQTVAAVAAAPAPQKEKAPAAVASAPEKEKAPATAAAAPPKAPAVAAQPAPAASVIPLGRRVALVVGNSAYQHTPALPNPRHDAGDVAKALEGLGFDVITGFDLTKVQMDHVFTDFARKVGDADAALFYYAGHAMQYDGVNYMMPVDATLTDAAGLPYEMARLDDVLSDMDRSHGVRIAVLDACRDNPLDDRLKSRLAHTRGGTVTRGLARIPRSDGFLIAFATQPGAVAEDGDGGNSPFTAALLSQIATPGLEVGLLFRRVTGAVRKATDGKQNPELLISLDGEFYFHP